MTIVINDTAPRIHYTAFDGQTVFDIPFEFIENNHVYVYINEQQKLFDETPVTPDEYRLVGAGLNEIKQVIFGGGRTAGDLVVIYRDVPIEDVGDFDTDGVFDVDALNRALDDIVLMIQQTEVNVEQRALRLAPADGPMALTTLPNLAARANKLLGFDANGQPVAMIGGEGGGSVGTADDSLALNGQPGSYYLDRTNHTGQDEIGDITGLQGALDTKAPINSPTFTGDPHSVTPVADSNDTSIATTAFVQSELQGKLDDAPNDALLYGRKAGAWAEAVGEAPVNSLLYGRINKQWVEIVGGGGGGGGASIIIADEPPAATFSGTLWWDSDQGGLYLWFDDGTSQQWVQVATPTATDLSQFVTKSYLVGQYLPLTGGTLSGQLTATNFIANNNRFAGLGNTIIGTGGLAGNPLGYIYFRPQGTEVSSPQSYISNLGDFVSAGAVLGNSYIGSSATSVVLFNTVSGNLYLRPAGKTDATGQMIIGPTGNVTVGGDLTLPAGKILYAPIHEAGTFSTTGASLGWTNDNGGTWARRSSVNVATSLAHLVFYNTNGPVGSVSTLNATTVFSTTSDENLKEFKAEYDPAEAIAIIRADPVLAYTWKSDGRQAVGWFAQKSHAVSDDLAVPPPEPEEGQAKPAPGETGYQPWGIDYGRRTPYLWAAMSGLLDRIDKLEARLAALEGA